MRGVKANNDLNQEIYTLLFSSKYRYTFCLKMPLQVLNKQNLAASARLVFYYLKNREVFQLIAIVMKPTTVTELIGIKIEDTRGVS